MSDGRSRPMDPFAFLDATAQADLVRRKEVTPVELGDAAIARIERVTPRLNAVVTPMYDLARRAALEQSVTTSSLAGPFRGVPFLLKDLGAEDAGVGFTEGSAFLAGHYVSAEDSELVVRLKRAGLIVLGKTNTPEFGILPTTEPRLFGPARNPWDKGRTPGGSSGGSAGAGGAGPGGGSPRPHTGGPVRPPGAPRGGPGGK